MNNETKVFEREGKGISGAWEARGTREKGGNETLPSPSRALEFTVEGLEGYFRDPVFDPKYGAGFGKTQNFLTGYGIWPRDSPKSWRGMRDSFSEKEVGMLD